MTSNYNLSLVIFSFVIAVFASYTALDLGGKERATRGKARFLWLLGGSAAMGVGIWSMHFVAMLAFQLSWPVNYQVGETLLSLVYALAASGLALWLLGYSQSHFLSLLMGGTLMGLAIASMHYTGMAAMEVQAVMEFNPWLVALSILIAIWASVAALWLAFYFQTAQTEGVNWPKIGSAVVMGIAISGMHYTGMAATHFRPAPNLPVIAAGINPTILATMIGVATVFLLSITLISSIIEQNFADLESRVRARTAELLQAKEAAEMAQEAAEVANRAKTVFLSHMSHELRTPLNGILGFSQILQRDPHLTSKQLDGLQTIHQCGSHLLTLIGDILDLAKIEAEKLELEESDWYFEDLFESLIAIISLKAQKKGIAFNYQPQHPLPTLVRGDQKRLRQVLLNLLSNAVKFTETGSVTLKVGYGDNELASDQEPNISPSAINHQPSINHQPKIRFQVEDTGIGIPAAQLTEIFAPFQQAVEGQFAQEGTGLGLTISQNIVRQMGGEINVESTLGQGSIFWFEIDLPAIESSFPVKTTDCPPRIIGFEGQAQPILVVDDKAHNRAVLKEFLAPLGFEVIEATNGEECLAQAKQYLPGLILLDLVMPVLDGFETSRLLRQEPHLNQVIIIATSASILPEDEGLSYQAGCNAFLTKPLDFEQLLKLFEVHLNLEWTYEQIRTTTLHAHPAVKPDSEEKSDNAFLVAPYEGELTLLLELAKQGYIASILDRAGQIEQLGSQYLPFAHKLRQLAESFQEKKLRQFIEEQLLENS